MKLYGSIASPYVARVVLFAKIKGVELQPSEAPGGGIKSPEYLKLNPIGKMPTLEVNGQGIGESAVICDYLEDAYPQKSGLPKDPLDRARSRLVARIVDIYISPAIGPIFRNMNPAKRDTAAVETALQDLTKACGYIEHAMGAGPFCVGATPTLGDCTLAPTTVLVRKMLGAGNFGVPDPTSTPRLQAWWKAMEGHADCKAILDVHATALDAFLKTMAGRR
ncbi:MAG: glutathione S-transferase family protein [Gammaproteobacteria bacterium]|nr:glutathione S-transferase family protein [Gammaproteobacteria bacterium]